MDFFESQEDARRRTSRLVVLFVLGAIAIAASLYAVAVVASGYRGVDAYSGSPVFEFVWLDPELIALVGAATLLVVGGGSLFKMAQLRRGGGRFVAESLGGRLLHADALDPRERRVLNVVEEMAIASGTPVPPVYLLDREEGINAFAAGFASEDAVVAVTRGCVEQLSREELQGVIAHEFSHVLNGDMRMNIRLMGILHGILIVGILGYYLFRVTVYASHGRRSERGGGIAAALPLIGLALAAIGFLGTFFGNWIKASVSRQREFLADASAVQFTRQPDGIAGALKKIGGYAAGSTLDHPNAPEASHAYFAQGVASGLSSVFATHPPLAERIGRLDPTFSGDVGEGAPAVAAGGGDARLSGLSDASEAVRHVGRPTPAHIAFAGALRDRLPDVLVAAAREPWAARAVVYCLLVSREAPIRALQLDRLDASLDASLGRSVRDLLGALDTTDDIARLPLLDLCLPALLELTPGQYADFRDTLAMLIDADDRVDLFEWALQRVLLAHLAPAFEPRRAARGRVRPTRWERLGRPLSVCLSTLAQVHPEDPARIERAFDAGRRALAAEGDAPTVELLPRAAVGLGVLDEALASLAEAAPGRKRALVAACAAVVASDGRLTSHEAELLRAVSAALGCPMPPVLATPAA